MKQKRVRLSKSPVSKLLTLTEDIGYYDCKNFILESAVKKFNGFAHWIAHLDYVRIRLGGYENMYDAGENFEKVKAITIDGLRSEGFEEQANELDLIHDETTFNSNIISQYTDETDLYYTVNKLLRKGHHGVNVGEHNLVPWILQLNSSIRKLPEVRGPVFRGTEMKQSDIDKYIADQIFIWSAFSSFSKTQSNCLEGNVIFEMTPVSGIAERDKRSPRDISNYSKFI